MSTETDRTSRFSSLSTEKKLLEKIIEDFYNHVRNNFAAVDRGGCLGFM